MVDTIRSRTELEDIFSDGKLRGVDGATLQDIRDLIASIGIAGTMYCTNVSFAVTSTWQPLAIFTDSIDNYGIQDDLPNGEFILKGGMTGSTTIKAKTAISVFYPSGPSGWAEVIMTKKPVGGSAGLTPYFQRVNLDAGSYDLFSILGSGQLSRDDATGLAIRASGAATIELSGQFQVST